MTWVKFRGSGLFPENAWGNGLTFCMLMYSNHFPNWLDYGHGLLIFVILLLFWLSETGQIWGFRAFPGERKFCILMYPDHLQHHLDYGHGLLIVLILVLFWLSETGKIWGFRAFSGEPIEELAWDFACWYILITVRIDKFVATVSWYF